MKPSNPIKLEEIERELVSDICNRTFDDKRLGEVSGVALNVIVGIVINRIKPLLSQSYQSGYQEAIKEMEKVIGEDEPIENDLYGHKQLKNIFRERLRQKLKEMKK